MLFPPIDPNERFRERRAAVRRRKRQRRAALIGVLLVGVALAGLGAQFVGGTGQDEPVSVDAATPLQSSPRPYGRFRVEIRGVHVTMGLASLPGKLEEYVALEDEGLTAIELDVKDEDGQVGFTPARCACANAGRRGARATTRRARPRGSSTSEGLYLIGRVVVFEDPVLAHARPDLAVRRSDGSVWEDAAGLAWTNPYDKRVWDYNIAIAAAAARSGLRRDHVRLRPLPVRRRRRRAPSTASERARAKNDAVPAFLALRRRSRLEPLGVRVSAAAVRALRRA